MRDWTKIAAYLLTPPERARFQRVEAQRAYNEMRSREFQQRWKTA
jgi:hypothetical protein